MTTPAPPLELPQLPDTDREVLSGARTPLRHEVDATGPFEVDGALPPAFDGTLFLLGPNPILVKDPDAYDPIDGDGMVHSLTFTKRVPTAQRSRMVVTRNLVDTLGVLAPPGPLSAAGPVANRRLATVADRLLALDGRGLGYRLFPSLTTAMVEDFDATLNGPMGFHVMVDHQTKGAAFLSWNPLRAPHLSYVEVSGDGVVTHATPLPIGAIGAEPSLGASATTLAVVESSLLAHEAQDQDDDRRSLSFDPDRRPCVGLLPRGADGSQVAWCTSEPGHTFDVASLSDTEHGADLVVLRTSPERADDASWRPTLERGTLARVAVDADRGTSATTALDDTVVDGLSVDTTTSMEERRFAYAAAEEGASLVRFDLRTGAAVRHQLPAHLRADRPVFMPDPEGHGDDEGWVTAVCFDAETRRSTLVVLDGTNVAGPAQSLVRLPARLAFGTTGLFLPAAER